MKISTFNANSIRSRLPIICDWLTMHDPDILGIQETKVQDSDFPKEIFLKLGFKTEFLGQKSYNGVCILFNKKAELYIQPEWSKADEHMSVMLDFLNENPNWKLSLQTHKFLNIP